MHMCEHSVWGACCLCCLDVIVCVMCCVLSVWMCGVHVSVEWAYVVCLVCVVCVCAYVCTYVCLSVRMLCVYI